MTIVDWYAYGMRLLAIVALCLAIAGCPRHKRHTLVPSVPTDGDPSARAKFLEARERFLQDGSGGDDLARIAQDYPDDPIAPFAGLYAGIAAEQGGDHAAAIERLETVVDAKDVDAGIVTRAELFLGLAYNGQGDADKAVPLLARGEPAIESESERGLWIAASAVATVTIAPLDALPWLDRYWAVAVDSERGWILATLDAIVTAASPEDARAAWDRLETKTGPVGAVLGARVADDDPAIADQVRGTIAGARADLGLPELAKPAEDAPPGPIGAILPLDGKQSRVGEAAARGLAIAAGAHGGASLATIDIADASGADASADAVAKLADAGALAIVGPFDGDSVDAAAERAETEGIALLSLNPRADERPEAGRHVFHAMHSAEARARALARKAVALGLKKVAILAPESGYGRAVATAFGDALKDAGGKLGERVDYASDTTSFAKIVKKLDGSWDAVFVPDDADRLELIAPALAAGGLVPRAPGAKVDKKMGRAIVLLSTAEGMDPETIRDAGRHLVGGLLAPGFYPAESDPTIAAFVDRYRIAHARLPTAVDAYAHDAALAIAAAGGPDATRASVAKRLEAVEVDGATGKLRFGKDHRRADDGVIFTVSDDGTTVSALR